MSFWRREVVERAPNRETRTHVTEIRRGAAFRKIAQFRLTRFFRLVFSTQFNLKQLTPFTIGWTGAEIEQCVVSSLTQARLADREISEQDLIDVAVRIVPLSRTMKEQINHIRGWAFERAVRASPQAFDR